jgi:hypothetical protein
VVVVVVVVVVVAVVAVVVAVVVVVTFRKRDHLYRLKILQRLEHRKLDVR